MMGGIHLGPWFNTYNREPFLVFMSNEGHKCEQILNLPSNIYI